MRKDIAIDIDAGKGQLRDTLKSSAFVYQRRIPEPYPYTKFRWPAGRGLNLLWVLAVLGVTSV